LIQPLFLENGILFVLDQRLLPHKVKYIKIISADEGFDAIAKMIVRGAPLIGITAFYALAAEARNTKSKDIAAHLLKKAAKVNSARPTAVNLNFAVREFVKLVKIFSAKPGFAKIAAVKAAEFHAREAKATRLMAKNGARLIKEGSAVLTYCNAGALAAPDYGTALGVIFEAHKQGKVREVFTCETRPYLQGMRLTSFELAEAKIPHRIISDNTAGFLMKKGMIDAVVVGADRIAANGDTANKIGTFTLAVLAGHHKIPFYVAAPVTTIDLSIKTGKEIPIEERSDAELLNIGGKRIAPKSSKGLYFGFDVTENNLITAIITEKGVASPVSASALKNLTGKS
jgi:methylthioribose-1-phosphate isomerase